VKISTRQSPTHSRRHRAPFSPEQIQQHLRGLRRSGLSAAAYARQQNLCYGTLLYWLKHKRSAAVPRSGLPGFQTMSLNSVLGPSWAVEVIGAGGLTVRLNPQVPPALARQLIERVCRPC